MQSKRYTPTTALSKPCAECGKGILGIPSELAKRKYCSKGCVGASKKGIKKKEWVTIRCLHCRNDFQVTPGWVRTGRRKYCSKLCRNKTNAEKISSQPLHLGIPHTSESRALMSSAQTGKFLREKSSQWKGGRYMDKSGYIHVMVSTLPADYQTMALQMDTKKYILEHRIIAAMTLKRPILSTEVVHHLNGVKDDNRPENLFVIPRAEHSMEHRAIEKELLNLRIEVNRLRSENFDLRSKLV